MSINIFGTYVIKNKVTYQPRKKCIDCPLFDEGLCWCRYLKCKIADWNYHDECPVRQITVEEE
jgi:hypothetical protein